MSDFKVGQKCVYIKSDPLPPMPGTWNDIGDHAQYGVIYEVRWVGMYKFNNGEQPALRLVEIKRVTQNPSQPSQVALDIPWGQRYFRPLQEGKVSQAVSKTVEKFRQFAKDVTEGKVVKIDEEA